MGNIGTRGSFSHNGATVMEFDSCYGGQLGEHNGFRFVEISIIHYAMHGDLVSLKWNHWTRNILCKRSVHSSHAQLHDNRITIHLTPFLLMDVFHLIESRQYVYTEDAISTKICCEGQRVKNKQPPSRTLEK